MTFTAELRIDSELYVEQGAPLRTEADAATFRSLGGTRCVVSRPQGYASGTSAGYMLVRFEGSAQALALLLANGCTDNRAPLADALTAADAL